MQTADTIITGKMNTAIVTGPTGAVGMALIEELAQQGIAVYAVCHRGSARKGRITALEACYPDRVHLVECDLDEMERLPDMITTARIDVFYHLAWSGTTGAARNDAAMQQQNIAYALTAVRAAQQLGCRLFVGAGSQAEYGLNPDQKPLRPDTPCHPFTEYGQAKLTAGLATERLCGELGIAHVWVRILSVYGPYDGMQSMVMSTMDQLMRGISPQLTACQQQWDYLYAGDAARALLSLGRTFGTESSKLRKDNRHLYCLGSGAARPLMEYAMTIAETVHRYLIAQDDGDCAACGAQLGGSVDITFGALPYSENQIMYLCADISDLTRDTGWRPTTDFATGMRKTLDWYLEQTR